MGKLLSLTSSSSFTAAVRGAAQAAAAQEKTPWPPWPSYPPPPPPWLRRPTRAFLPYFGPPPPIQSVAMPQPSYCSPDPVTGNLPFDCIDIIDVSCPTNHA